MVEDVEEQIHVPKSSLPALLGAVKSTGETNITMENTNFSWDNEVCLWPCSIATLDYQRVYNIH